MVSPETDQGGGQVTIDELINHAREAHRHMMIVANETESKVMMAAVNLETRWETEVITKLEEATRC